MRIVYCDLVFVVDGDAAALNENGMKIRLDEQQFTELMHRLEEMEARIEGLEKNTRAYLALGYEESLKHDSKIKNSAENN